MSPAGAFEVLPETARISSLTKEKDDPSVRVFEATTVSGQRIDIVVPIGQNAVAFIKRAMELSQLGATGGKLEIQTGE